VVDLVGLVLCAVDPHAATAKPIPATRDALKSVLGFMPDRLPLAQIAQSRPKQSPNISGLRHN
jgi:hypothetical protein